MLRHARWASATLIPTCLDNLCVVLVTKDLMSNEKQKKTAECKGESRKKYGAVSAKCEADEPVAHDHMLLGSKIHGTQS